MNTDTSLMTFKAISNFTKDLGEFFASKQHSLRLYCRLINKTTLSHEKSIHKHINSFRTFCIKNRDAIKLKDIKLIDTNFKKISYSEKVYIDMVEIFKLADNDTQLVIWKHLLFLSALLDPAGKAKDILKNNITSSNDKENDFLCDIISKVEQNVNPAASPLEAVSSIMKSGVFNDIIGNMNKGFEDGSLNLGKLMNSVQNIVNKIDDSSTPTNNSDSSMNIINTMLGNLLKNDGSSSSPDLNSMLGPILNSLTNKNDGSSSSPDLNSMLGPILNSLTNKNDGSSSSPPDLNSMLGPILNSLTNKNDGSSSSPPELNSMLEPILNSLTNKNDGSSSSPPELNSIKTNVIEKND
jgi:hypothetical protein